MSTRCRTLARSHRCSRTPEPWDPGQVAHPLATNVFCACRALVWVPAAIGASASGPRTIYPTLNAAPDQTAERSRPRLSTFNHAPSRPPFPEKPTLTGPEIRTHVVCARAQQLKGAPTPAIRIALTLCQRNAPCRAASACANLPCHRSNPLGRGGSVHRMGSGASSDNIVVLSEQGSEIIADAAKDSDSRFAASLREGPDWPEASRSVSGGGSHSSADGDSPELHTKAPAGTPSEDNSGRTVGSRPASLEAPRLWNENDDAYQGASRLSLRQRPGAPPPRALPPVQRTDTQAGKTAHIYPFSGPE